VIVHNAELAEEVRMTTVHGQNIKYHHQIIGCNSRLDTLQAAILNAKLSHIDEFISARQAVAKRYDEALMDIQKFNYPIVHDLDSVYHQYTFKSKRKKRGLQNICMSRYPCFNYIIFPYARSSRI
jgi:dTDP-4-amino-4,6-dideoxygalactose transaminase